MLQTKLVNFSLVVWAVTAYFSCTMWDGNVHWIFHCFISAQEKHFINDTIRSEFHRKFMDKYVRWRKALSTDLPPSIMHYTQNCNISLCSFIFGKKVTHPRLIHVEWRHMVIGFIHTQLRPLTVEPRGHPSTADTHDITDNSVSPDCPSVHSIHKQPLNSGHPTTSYNPTPI